MNRKTSLHLENQQDYFDVFNKIKRLTNMEMSSHSFQVQLACSKKLINILLLLCDLLAF